jgi:hypothetical protein
VAPAGPWARVTGTIYLYESEPSMIDPQEFTTAGFTDEQAAALVRVLERVERTSGQRFALLQEAMNDGFVRQQQQLDRLHESFERQHQRLERLDEGVERLNQQVERLSTLIGRLPDVVTEGMQVQERALAQVDQRLTRVEARLNDIEGYLRRPGQN